MIYKSLHFKLVLILVLIIISIISIVGTILFNSVFDFYISSFTKQISEGFGDEIVAELTKQLEYDDYAARQKDILKGISGSLGINNNRNYYILNMNGTYQSGSDADLGQKLIKTPNIVSAMNKKTAYEQIFGSDYMDYAMHLSYGEAGSEEFRECIVYIKDSQEEMKKFSWMIFSIIIQALLIGLIVAIILSFFLANAISSPIQNITKGAQKLATGDFKKTLKVMSNDEIGILTTTFNEMAKNLQDTLDEVSGEREKLQTIFLYLKDGVFVFSADRVLLLMNRQGGEIIGGSLDADSSFDKFLSLFGLTVDNEKWDDKKSGGVVFHDIQYNSSVFDINIGKFRYTQNQLQSDGIIVVIHDTTQRYALEKSRREFIANVSHELKTPLTVIRGATETVYENPTLPDDIKDKFLSSIISESDRMSRIVRDLLVVSRLENKKMLWKFSPVDPERLVSSLHYSMQSEAQKKNIELVYEPENDITEIIADKERIEQVVVNIIFNAIKYTKENGRVKISLSNYEIKNKESNFYGIRITVADNGVGIPEDDLPNIFERFYRVEKARSTEMGGTGLGLAIAKEIVLAHKGQITVDSKVGSGTTVNIILPKGDMSLEKEINTPPEPKSADWT